LVAAIQTGSINALTLALTNLLETNDFLVWLYLLFTIANAMLPSRSDRRAWPAFLLIMGILTVGVYLAGLQQVVVEGLAGPVTAVFGYLGLAFSLAIGVDIFFMLLIYLVESLISRIRGVSVVYGRVDNIPSTEKIIP
jgi:flagellar biosynthesis component FlhA